MISGCKGLIPVESLFLSFDPSVLLRSPVLYPIQEKKALTAIKALIDKLFESLDQNNHNMHSKPRANKCKELKVDNVNKLKSRRNE